MTDSSASTGVRARARAAQVALVVGLLLMAGKLAAALCTGSRALLSDALESLVNVAAAAMAWFAVRWGQRPADAGHPFGPVISYTRPRWREPRRLGQSNLCFETQLGIIERSSAPYSSHYVPQPPEFLAWARRVMSWNRRRIESRGHDRATPGAWAAAAAGEVALVA